MEEQQELSEKLLLSTPDAVDVHIDDGRPQGLFVPLNPSSTVSGSGSGSGMGGVGSGPFDFSAQDATAATGGTTTTNTTHHHYSNNNNHHHVIDVSTSRNEYTGGVGGGSNRNNGSSSSSGEYGGEKQPDGYRDAGFAVLFLIHVAIMVWYGLVHGISHIRYDAPRFGTTITLHFGGIFIVFLLACTVGFGWTATLIALLTRYMEQLITVALGFTLILQSIMVIVYLYQRYWVGFGFAVFFLVYTGMYAQNIWRRLPLTTAILNTALQALQTNAGVAIVAYGTVFVLCLYTILWILAGIGIYVETSYDSSSSSSSSIHVQTSVLILFVFAYAWTTNVLKNILHATISGVVATWWFAPNDAQQFWSPAITDSLIRATTYSFGSLCLASLLTATVQTLYHVVRYMNRLSRSTSCHRRGSFTACISECVLGFLARLIQYFHRYALVYVAVYGYDFLTAGQKTSELFASRGWTMTINDDLIARVLSLTSIVVGFGTSACVLMLYNPSWIQDYFYNTDTGSDDENTSSASSFGICFALSLILGTAVSSVVLSMVASATDTVLVAFAEAPGDLEQNHPGLYQQMNDAWEIIYPLRLQEEVVPAEDARPERRYTNTNTRSSNDNDDPFFGGNGSSSDAGDYTRPEFTSV